MPVTRVRNWQLTDEIFVPSQLTIRDSESADANLIKMNFNWDTFTNSYRTNMAGFWTDSFQDASGVMLPDSNHIVEGGSLTYRNPTLSYTGTFNKLGDNCKSKMVATLTVKQDLILESITCQFWNNGGVDWYVYFNLTGPDVSLERSGKYSYSAKPVLSLTGPVILRKGVSYQLSAYTPNSNALGAGICSGTNGASSYITINKSWGMSAKLRLTGSSDDIKSASLDIGFVPDTLVLRADVVAPFADSRAEFWVSRDDGVTWIPAELDTPVDMSQCLIGTQIAAKVRITDEARINCWSLAWK